ncbi:hypothetical protein [Variovorax sp. GT1P44]|uniref:hypothetical protein n=1 Tax=Variovorax sp. GT1P44 TaxID=3443742 RepID=UPI003F482514
MTGRSSAPGSIGFLAISRFSVVRTTTNGLFAIAAGIRAGAVVGAGRGTLGILAGL